MTAPINPTPAASKVAETAAPVPQSMAHKASRGVFWGLLTIALGQGASLLSQLILGYKLNSEFALNMVAVAAFATIGILRDAGLRKIAIVRASQFDTLARPLFILSLIVNAIAAVLLCAAAPWLAYHGFQEPQPKLMPMLWITAASFVISSFGVMESAKMAIDLRFKAFAAQSVASNLLRQGSQAGFALAGFAELSFALPLLLVAIFDAISFRYLAGKMPSHGRLTWPLFRSILRDTKWIMLTVLGMTLAYRADGFIVARFEDLDRVVTFYGWAVLLTFQVMQPFTATIYSTVLPAFVRIVDDLPRLGQAYLRMLGVVVFVSVPGTLAICLMLPLVIHLMPLWNGKWDAAIPVVVLFLIATPMKSLQASAIALDESRSRFDRSAFLNVADGICCLIAVSIGVMVGGLVAIGVAVAVERLIFCPIHCLVSGSKAGVSPRKILARVAPSIVAGAVVLTIVGAAVRYLPVANVYVHLAGWAIPGVLLYAALTWFWTPHLWRETWTVVAKRNAA